MVDAACADNFWLGAVGGLFLGGVSGLSVAVLVWIVYRRT
jgi:hypothetical protein